MIGEIDIMDWKKSTFKKEIEALIHKRMEELNYLYNKKRLSFIKKREDSYSAILYQTTMNDCPKSSVGFHFSCSIHLDEITEILSKLNNEISTTATLFGKMKTFTAQASNDGIYYFDWNKDYLNKLEELFKNVQEFDSFCEKIKSVSDLATEKLTLVPGQFSNHKLIYVE